MNVNKPSMMISREDVVRLLQTQADAFDKKFTEFEDIGADMILKQREMEANTDRTKDLGENMKTVVFASINTKEKQETAILTLQTQVANLTAEVGRLHDHLANHRGPSTSSLRDIRTQHDLIRGLITDMEKQADLTNTRQVKEANMVCNCTHKTINDNMAGMRRRMTNVSKHRCISLCIFIPDGTHPDILCLLDREEVQEETEAAPLCGQVRHEQ